MLVLDERYGSFARDTLVADLIEASLLIRGGQYTQARLADWLFDNRDSFNSTPKLKELDENPPQLTDRERADSSAGRIFALIGTRQRVLGRFYPFTKDQDLLVAHSGIERVCGYTLLLAVSLSHAYTLTGVRAPTTYFPVLVARAVDKKARVVNFGDHRASAANFRAALESARDVLGLGVADEESVIVHSAANDSGADILAHVSWHDDIRPGRWLWVGQVTCGQSDTWERKAGEPKKPRWRKLMGEVVEPVTFLAVPHHVEDHHLRSLLDGEVFVLDRLRLAPWLGEADCLDGLPYLRAIAAAGVEIH